MQVEWEPGVDSFSQQPYWLEWKNVTELRPEAAREARAMEAQS